MRTLALLGVLAYFFTQTAPAQKREMPPGPLKSVRVTGNTLYTSEAIIASSGLKLGQNVSPSVLSQAQKKLQGFQLFNRVGWKFETTPSMPPQYDVTFTVEENQQLFPMRFERLGDAEEIRDYLRTHVDLYADRIPGTDAVLQRYRAAVETFIEQKQPNTKVRVVVSNDDPKELTVLFTPNEPAPAISQVEVTGNQAVDTGTILRAVNEVAIGVPLSEMRLKMILDGAIKPVYAARGYAAVSFPKWKSCPRPPIPA